jgi:hypothetical protein
VAAWDAATRGLHRDLRFMFPGTADSLQLRAIPPATGLFHRAVLAGLLVMGTVVMFVAARRLGLFDIGAECPQLLLAVVGILISLWVSPSWIGISLTLLALLSAWRLPWSAPHLGRA